MIFVTRGAKPKVLTKSEAKWLTKLKSATGPKAKRRAVKKYRHSEIVRSLDQMFHGKCAYCESHIKHVDYPHVEHFHPVNGPMGDQTLTFAWDNLLLACAVCNGIQYKSDKFPGPGEGGPLLNPCVDNPDDHLDFLYDTATNMTLVAGKTPRGNTTERLLGLNRSDLREHRSRYITRIAAIARFAATDPEAARLLREAKQPTAEYSRFSQLF